MPCQRLGPSSFCAATWPRKTFCRQVVEAAVAKWGGVDYLVNNAFSFIAKGDRCDA